MININPSQKIGMETPMRDPIMLAASHTELRREAAIIPAGTPMSTATNMALRASSMVAGKRCFNSWAIGIRR